MRAIKLGVLALIAAAAAIGILRITGLITEAQLPWLATRAFAAIALLLVAGVAIGAVAPRPVAPDSTDRPIP